jgi:hypothetical protein
MPLPLGISPLLFSVRLGFERRIEWHSVSCLLGRVSFLHLFRHRAESKRAWPYFPRSFLFLSLLLEIGVITLQSQSSLPLHLLQNPNLRIPLQPQLLQLIINLLVPAYRAFPLLHPFTQFIFFLF